MTVLEVLRRSSAYLGRAGISSPRFESEVILADALGLSRLDLYLQFERPLDEVEVTRLRELIQRRGQGTPMAYLLAVREFYGLSFKVGPGVLVPRPETELLVELGLAVLDRGARRCADLGSGTGCVGVALAVNRPFLEVEAVDLSDQAVQLTVENGRRHGVQDRLRVLRGSWAEPLHGRGEFPLILSNPPYVTSAEYCALDPGVRDFEPRVALDGGTDGLDSYRALLASLPPVAAQGTTLLLETDPRRMDRLILLCQEAWPHGVAAVHQDLSGRSRVLEFQL
ncbi:MAG: peptide chain release factor N(5)-glutamine methyltransferase [Candidatus Dormiibacterota bacterium]